MLTKKKTITKKKATLARKKVVKKTKPTKKVVPAKKVKKEKLVGKIVHFFSNIKVAIVKLSGPLSVGDEIRVVGGKKTNFTQKIASIEVDHKKKKKAKKGEEVGLKVKKKAREGYELFKI